MSECVCVYVYVKHMLSVFRCKVLEIREREFCAKSNIGVTYYMTHSVERVVL